MSQVTLESVWRNYDEHCGVSENSIDAGGKGSAEKINSNEFLEKDLLWGKDRNAEDVTEEALTSARTSISAVGHEVPVSKKGCLELVRMLADDDQVAQHGSEGTTSQLARCEAKIEES